MSGEIKDGGLLAALNGPSGSLDEWLEENNESEARKAIRALMGERNDPLRDQFAGNAMQGIVSSIDSEENYVRLARHAQADGLKVSQWIAREAYKQADAMLAAREVQS